MSIGASLAATQASMPEQSFLSRLLDHLANEPALLELILVLVAVATALVVLGSLGRAVERARGRRAILDYLLGVEQAEAGDHVGADRRLARVLAEHPENAEARLVRAETLRELGRSVEAHAEHVQLAAAFGVASVRNDKGLARCLLDLEQHAHEAVGPARAAVLAAPKDKEAALLGFEAELAAGEVEPAAASAFRLAALLQPGEARARVLARAAKAVAVKAQARLLAGDQAEATRLLGIARDLVEDAPEVLLLEARLVHRAEGEAGLQRLLLARDGTAPRDARPTLLPAVAGGNAVSTEVRVAALQRWTPRERLGELEREIESPEAVLDEVEENRAYKKSLVERAAALDRSAEDELVLLRDAAAEDLLALALSGPNGCEIASRCFSRMGAGILPALFAAYARMRERRPFGIGSLFGTNAATVVGRIAQGFGRDALPHFEALLVALDRDLRKIALDYYVGLGDPAAFERVVEWIAPLEIIHRLNAAAPALLRPFLARLATGTVLADLLLVDPTFHRDVELVHALRAAGSESAAAIVEVLKRRGYDGDLAEALLDELGDPRLEAPVWAVLDSYGPPAIDHLVSAYADLDRPGEVRTKLRRALLARGAPIVGRICTCFGTAPSPLDAELQSLLAEVGTGGIEPLVDAYDQSSWRERLSAGLVSRYTNRRVAIVRTLTAIAGPDALRALERLLESETDANLRLRLQEALQRRRA